MPLGSLDIPSLRTPDIFAGKYSEMGINPKEIGRSGSWQRGEIIARMRQVTGRNHATEGRFYSEVQLTVDPSQQVGTVSGQLVIRRSVLLILDNTAQLVGIQAACEAFKYDDNTGIVSAAGYVAMRVNDQDCFTPLAQGGAGVGSYTSSLFRAIGDPFAYTIDLRVPTDSSVSRP